MNDEPIYIPESIQAGTIAEISQKGEVYVIINKEDIKYFAEQIVTRKTVFSRLMAWMILWSPVRKP